MYQVMSCLKSLNLRFDIERHSDLNLNSSFRIEPANHNQYELSDASESISSTSTEAPSSHVSLCK